jgi:hypothetical protein
MKFASAALGGMLAVTSVASAGVVEDYFVFGASGGGQYGMDPGWNVFDTQTSAVGTRSVDANSDTEVGGWGDGVYARVQASNTSTKSGDNYGWSGTVSTLFQHSSSEFDGASATVSSQIRFTLTETTEVSMALSWLVSSQTSTNQYPTGQFGLFDRIGTSLQYELVADAGIGASESLTGSTTLAAGEYYFFFQLNSGVMHDANHAGHNQLDMSFQASLNFGGGGGGGGAVPGLGALAPLAAAGLTRRRRR